MLKNYITIAFRNLVRHKVFSFINIFGLAVGMACTILILLWVQDELSYDTFHKNAENTYLVLRGDNNGMTAVTSTRLGPALMQEFPEVKRMTCYMPVPEAFTCVVRNGEKAFEERIALADTQFFNVFSIRLREGDPATALRDPSSMVIADKIRRKYFGEEDAVGKSLTVTAFGHQLTMKVTGVMAEIPSNSDIQPQVMFNFGWLEAVGIKDYGWQNQSSETFIQLGSPLASSREIEELSSRIKACEVRHDPYEPKSLYYSLIPLTNIHLHGSGIKFFVKSTGDIKYVRIFLAIAITILLIAGMNYMNLSTALSLQRTREVGIRKTIGANRASLLLQFLGESMGLSLVALIIAILLVELFLPGFNRLSGKTLVIRYDDFRFLGIAFVVAISAGVVSGSYPALFFSSFTPVQMLKGILKLSGTNIFVRKGLVVFQFALSTIIIVGTIVIFNQLSFIRKSNLGFDKENVLCIRMIGEANNRFEAFKNEIRMSPDVLAISRSEPLNNSSLGSTTGVNWPRKAPNEDKHFWVLHSDCDLASTYKFEMMEGRYYSEDYPSDATDAYVINEAAAKSMNLKSPLSEQIQVWGRTGRIVGVTKDFHFASFHSVIEPLIFRIPDKNEQGARFALTSIRLKAGTLEEGVASIRQVWAEQMAGIPLNYFFVDDALNAQYSSEQQMSSIFEYFSFLSILIACLGLFGLASLSAQQRTKEIGIRKVLGASMSHLTMILSKEFLVSVIVSNCIAWPVSYYVMRAWLQSFAYRVDLSWWIFALAGGVALTVAVMTVSWHATKAAMANPVKSLRYE